MERLIILVIWITVITMFSNTKNNKGKTKTTTARQGRKSIFGTFIEELEKEKQRFEGSRGPVQPSKASVRPDIPKPKAPQKPKETPKPVGLEVDIIGGDEEIGGINEANISLKSNRNNLGLDLKEDILKGIIYSEILSEPKSLRNIKRRTL